MYDTRLIAEHYDVQPQDIVWMLREFAEDGEQIIGFHYTYSNDEGLKYLNLTRDQLAGLSLSNSPTLIDELRKAILVEMTAVYQRVKSLKQIFLTRLLISALGCYDLNYAKGC